MPRFAPLAAAAALLLIPTDGHAEEGRSTTAAAAPVNAREKVRLGDAYAAGEGVKQSYKDARAWYAKAGDQGDTEAMRKLGQLYAEGKGGKKNAKKAVEQWIKADKAGDPLAATLVADAYYEDITGSKTPKPGQFAFQDNVPVSRIDDAIAWYEAAQKQDPRPEVQERSQMALYVLRTLRQAGATKVKK